MTVSELEKRRVGLDSVVRLVTPERIMLEYPIAGPFRRFCAYLIDLVLVVILIVGAVRLFMLLSMGSIASAGVAFVAFFLINWGYGAFCEGFFNGQTLGKHWLKIRVLGETGLPISGVQAILRNLVGAVDGVLPFCYLIGLSSMLASRGFRRLGDLAAGTMVVIEEDRWRRGITRIDEPAVNELLPWLPGRMSANSQVSRALSDYVNVRKRFTLARRADMAEHLAAPLRRQYGLPPQTSSDTVLCAVYHRIFLGEA